MTTPEQFEEACRRHDLTHAFADDGATWRAGNESLQRLQAMAREIGYDIAVPLWNKVVDAKLAPESRAMFYWPVPATQDDVA